MQFHVGKRVVVVRLKNCHFEYVTVLQWGKENGEDCSQPPPGQLRW